MLSNKSEQFLVELRMYLISKGKKDSEIKDVVSELEDHLTQAEAAGKSVENIVGSSPKAYMKSIGQSMPTDYREIAILTPMMLLLLAAYFIWPHAIAGNFSITGPILSIAAIGGVAGIVAYGILLFRGLPKLLHSRWFYVIGLLVNFILVGVGVVAFLWFNKFDSEPIFTATTFQNYLLVIACVVIFIVSAIYTKTWFTIIIPVVLAIGPLANRFLPQSVNENSTYIWIVGILGTIFILVALYFMFRKPKKLAK